VDDLSLGVLVEVDAGPVRHLVDLLLECHDSPDSASTSIVTAIARGSSTAHRSARSTRPSSGGLARPGRGGFMKASTLPRMNSATAAAPKATSANLKIMPAPRRARQTRPPPARRPPPAPGSAMRLPHLEVHLAQRLDPVPQLGRPLEVQPLRRLLHRALELGHVGGQRGRVLPP